MIQFQSYDTSLCHGHQPGEILPRSKIVKEVMTKTFCEMCSELDYGYDKV